MFRRRQIEVKIDEEINFLLDKLGTLREKSQEYDATTDRIAALNKLKSEGFRLPSLDTVLIVGANIFGIIWLTRFEKEEVIPSKSAFNLMLKPH